MANLWHLARERHWQKKWTTVSSSSVNLYPRQKNGSLILSTCLPITQWPVSMASVINVIPSTSKWIIRLISTKGQVFSLLQCSSLGDFVRPAVPRNVAVSGNSDYWYADVTPRKKIETTAYSPIQKRFNGALTDLLPHTLREALLKARWSLRTKPSWGRRNSDNNFG